MRKSTIVFALLVALLSGCGNSELESAIYRHHKGVYRCPACLESTREVVVRGHEASVYEDEAILPVLISGIQHHVMPSPIVKIKTSKTDFDDVWSVQVYVDCETHGSLVSETSEWSYKDKKLRFLK